jgi:hypothetical protein
MRAVSAAVVLLSGTILVATATAPTLPEPRSAGVAACGAIIGLVGLVCWLVAFFRDKDRA